MKNIILGSQSPRRRELMAGLDCPFTAVSIDADESFPAQLKAGDIPLYIARAKARAYGKPLGKDDVLITSDTIVWLEDRMLGKPKDLADARSMLLSLSGKTHQVYTAVCVIADSKEYTLVDCTDVTFRDMTDEEIGYYVEKYKPLDKAGAYGVQEWIGYVGVSSMLGSYFNVMGFPIERVYLLLKDLGCLE
ncbi:MAG: Maf family nucleotide pyrophosphatase [Paludibacteraceae bacterium]|nr:Maf family nucleotide pyrophosphatase [Paludibacteraceae bacterium]